ncbi:MAG: lamin tail domain-containing protein [Saprospiraceae bacterium]
MKQTLLLIFLAIFPISLFGQLSEDFSDGDFSNNPTWQGDLNKFIVNSDGELQLNTSGSDTSILYTAVEIPDSTVWEMDFKMDFAPSNNNRLRIYLQSSTTNYPDVDGYFLEIGETGATDRLTLFRSDAGTKTEIATATEGALGNDPAIAKIKITRSKTGDWAIFANYGNGNVLNLEATTFDDTYLGGNLFFAFWCKNTSTNNQAFFFDNITITSLQPDVTPPSVLQVTPISLTELEVSFDEAMDSLTAATTGNYFVNNSIGSPQSSNWTSTNQSKVSLTFATPFSNQTNYNLDIQNVKDQANIPIIAASIPFTIDFESPELIDVITISSTELELEFNQPIEDITGSLSSNYIIDNGIGNPINVEIDPIEPFRIYLELSTPLSNGIEYILRVENLKNQLEIEINPQDFPFDFLIGAIIESGDFIINEILADPLSGGSDYVELYNNSDKFLDIADLIISNTTRTSGRDKNVENSFILKPGEYVVLTPAPFFTLLNYTVENPDFLIENDLPAFNISDGNISIFTSYGLDTVMIDSFDYDNDFHFPFIDDTKGISLERISFDAPTQNSSNWHSASTISGGGTPTYKNSQFRPTNPADDFFSIAEKTFSPDEDGFKDFLLIDYNFETQGYIASVNIYDAKGRLVKTLFENELLGQEGSLKWNGITDEGRKARIGIYIILAEIFSPTKEAMQFKSTCVVAGELN